LVLCHVHPVESILRRVNMIENQVTTPNRLS
jgi:hypothetical protein